MEIITIKPKVKVKGHVDIKVYDQEDLAKMEPKVHQYGRNDIHDNLLAKLIDAMDGSQPSTTIYHINTSSSWFTDRYAQSNGGDVNSQTTAMNQKDGIVAKGSVSTGGVTDTQSGEGGYNEVRHFFIHDAGQSGGGTTVSTDTCSWTAQATWNDPNGSSSNIIERLYLGNFYNVTSSTNGMGNDDADVTFDIMFADYNPSNFTVANNDVLKVTWSIQIGA
tara:strand:+ start:321 stop:980 length:660 start_codon:yes stop_codon:yes gene_type:complete